jgi:putative two-component system response regulator
MEAARRSILVVDDEEPIRKVLKTHLTKAGYDVVQSPGGKGIFDTLEETKFELLICDMKMPEVDGVDILKYTKEHFDTPVIMLTGLTDTAVAVDVMKQGAFDYVMKPVRKDDLLDTIRKALDYSDLLLRNRQLELENMEYQRSLETKVEERTGELKVKAKELEAAYGSMKSMSIQFVNVLAETIEAKDHYTRGHCNRMRYLCVELGRQVGLSPERLETLEYASLLHDLGKIGVNELILNKDGPLTEAECAKVREHPGIAEKILVDIPLMEQVASIVVAHHENFDGSGYPRSLPGVEIPVEARIIAVADLYDAMSSDRPYRKGLALEVVIEEMERVAGTQLDPGLVRLFIDNKIYSYIKN